MEKLNMESYFGKMNESRIGLLNQYQAEFDRCISQLHDYNHPLFSGTYTADIYSYLSECSLNKKPMEPEKVFDYMRYYFQNLPDWSYAGTMINVIPAVNLVSAAVSGIAELFNPNCAQDTYSGNLLIAELEVIKYMSELLGWDWLESTGIFTFGGTGTNLYATKLALLNADPESSSKGVVRGKYFSITSKNGHPCHYQLCDWLGLGSESCIEVPCTEAGDLDIAMTEQIVRRNLQLGKTFLGFNLTGGSTNEMLIDSVYEIYQLREHIVEEFSLDYRPMIHVDSVLGWVYLFFRDYDFSANPMEFMPDTLEVLKSLYAKAAQFRYADTLGIDFHKTGFCPYVTSLFLAKDKNSYFRLNPGKHYDIRTMGYGDYNPFYTSLEYSRSAKGPIAALTCLKSLGTDAFCELIGNLTESTRSFRSYLAKDSRICLIDPDTEGFATIFTLVPPGFRLNSAKDLQNLSEDSLEKLRKLNGAFGKKVLCDCVGHRTHFLFTSSRSYTLPGTDVRIGALKAYPMSVFFDREQALFLSREVSQSITELLADYDSGNQESSEFFKDMTKA